MALSQLLDKDKKTNDFMNARNQKNHIRRALFSNSIDFSKVKSHVSK